MESLATFTLPWNTLAQFAFYLLLIVYVIFTCIFYYHWQSYSMNRAATIQTYLAYFVISLPLLAIMGLSLLAI